jgi:uncharacterized protein YbjT (DUF2867 family)
MTRVLVTGANGRTGRAVIAALARLAGSATVSGGAHAAGGAVTIRAFIRRAEQAPALAALGAAEHAVGDLADAGSLEAALTGCDALVHIGPPMHPDEHAMMLRLIEVARRTQRRALRLLLRHASARREVRHHRLKLEAEESLVESGLTYSIVQPARYMQHLEGLWQTVTGQGVHAMPFSIDEACSVADLADLAEATARVVLESRADGATPGKHHYATYELGGPEPLSQRDMAGILSEELGRPVVAQALPLDVMAERARAAGLSEDRIEQMRVMNAHYDRHGFRGNPNVLTMLLGRPPTRYRDYVRRLIAQQRKE